MKRAKDIYIKIIDEANILAAIEEVNSTHRWNQGHKPNRTVLWVESTKPDLVKEIREIIENGSHQPRPGTAESTIRQPESGATSASRSSTPTNTSTMRSSKY